MTAILVTGGAGQVGQELVTRAWPAGVTVLAPGRQELNIADLEALRAFLKRSEIAAVINCAAYTAVDKAETEISAAFEGNAIGPALLATATHEAGIPLVHVSTDYVFDGAKPVAYEVDDPVGPIGAYGVSKVAGEFAVTSRNPRSVIVRTAWVVSPRGGNFVKTMLRYGRERDVMRIVADQHGAPTIAGDLAEALATIALRLISDREAPTGLFHFSNEGPTTWYGFAEAIFDVARSQGCKVPKTEPITTADYPTPARRPANSLLSTARISQDYGITPRPWRDGLPALIEDILRSGI